MSYDHILILGYGGPTSREEVVPFIQKIAQNKNIPEERIRFVTEQYEKIGGFSPYNENAFQLKKNLSTALDKIGIKIPIFIGMKNWHPFIEDVVQDIAKQGFKKGLAFILSAFRSEVSYDRYKEDVRNSLAKHASASLQYLFLNEWYRDENFMEAQAQVAWEALNHFPTSLRDEIPIIFSAHSIPIQMNENCPHCSYSDEFKISSQLVAERINHKKWFLGYQSRSGSGKEPWLEPDIREVIQDLSRGGEKGVVVVPRGFLCDHMEVLYDLDCSAKQTAEANGIQYVRAKTIMKHPKFIQMLTETIQRKKEPVSL